MFPTVSVSDRVARSLQAIGPAGQAWLSGLPGLVAGLAADWSVTVGNPLSGGQAAYVTEAMTYDGRPVVIKVSIPSETPFERQLTALRLAGGDPYVELIRHDVPRRALLLERLGRPSGSLGWPAPRRLDALTRIAARGWRPVPDDCRLPTAAEAARWHLDFARAAWDDLARPCPEAVVELAARCAAAREAAFDPGRAVLVHGDVHEFNALQAAGPAGFRLVDPSGLMSEPAHDLGVIQARGVQAWTDRLAASDPQRALDLVKRSCRRAGRLTGEDPEAVWQWAFTELVSTGLFVLRLGHHEASESLLAVAGKLTGAVASANPRRTPQAPRPTLMLMVGLPGAGKTTRAKELAAAHRALRLTPDEWMIPLFAHNEADGKRDVLEGRLITVALHALRLGTDVVLDFGLWSRDERSALRWLATSAGAACRVIYLPVDRDTQRARIAHREATEPQNTFPMTDADIDTWRPLFQPPDHAELSGATIPAPPPEWPGWPEWATDRWPSLDPT